MAHGDTLLVGDFKAYIVHDGDEGWAVVYATNGASARRHGANELDVDFSEIESCHREPSLDEFANAQIPITSMLDLGWWFECAGCGRKLRWDDDDEADLVDPVGTYHGLCWCTPTCRDEFLETRLWRESAQDLAVAKLTGWLRDRFPGIVPTRTHAYANDRCLVEQTVVNFSFAGASYGGGVVRVEDMYGRRGVRWPGEPADVKLTISRGDLNAWERYRDSLWARSEMPRMEDYQI